MKTRSRTQKGQALVLMAVSILALTGMVALSVDAGNGFTTRRKLQTAADAGAMAGAHLALEQVINGGAPDYTKQKTAALQFVSLNGVPNTDTITVQWVDSTGTAFANSGGLPVVPGGSTVQGMKLSIAATRNTLLFNILGISTVQISVSAMAQFGTPTGLAAAIPLALNSDAVHPLYTPILMQTDGGASGGAACAAGAGGSDNLGLAIPAAFVGLGAQNFHILHDPPTSSLATALATETTTHYGLNSTLSLGPTYYAESGNPSTTGFAKGVEDRVKDSRNNSIFNGDTPTAGGFSPINPRVYMVSINSASGLGGGGSLTLSEYLAFYTQFICYDTTTPSNGITLGGYFVNSTGVPGATGFGVPSAAGPKIFRLTQ